MNQRTTRYVRAVIEYVNYARHITNTEALTHLQTTYPDITATTVHRITARLVEHGKLAVAPIASGNVMRFDANSEPHDHFHCSSCDMLRDTMIADEIRPILERTIGDGCRISGNLVISGLCKKCNEEKYTI